MGNLNHIVKAIEKVQRLRTQWDDENLTNWDETHVRYTMIDPIIRARPGLGYRRPHRVPSRMALP